MKGQKGNQLKYFQENMEVDAHTGRVMQRSKAQSAGSLTDKMLKCKDEWF